MPPRGTKINEKMRSETTEKIINTAFEVFSEYGFKGTTMKQITKRANLSYGLIYHYFPSKEHIFRILVDNALNKSYETISEGLSINGSAWEKLKNLSKILVSRILTEESSRYFLIIIQAFSQGKNIPGLIEHIGEVSQAHYNLVVPVVIEAQKTGDVMDCDPIGLTATFLSAIQGLTILIFGGSGLEERVSPDILINLLQRK